MRNADQRALQKFQLRCALYGNCVTRKRPDLPGIEVMADGKAPVGSAHGFVKTCDAFSVSSESFRASLVRPVINMERRIAGVIEVQRV